MPYLEFFFLRYVLHENHLNDQQNTVRCKLSDIRSESAPEGVKHEAQTVDSNGAEFYRESTILHGKAFTFRVNLKLVCEITRGRSRGRHLSHRTRTCIQTRVQTRWRQRELQGFFLLRKEEEIEGRGRHGGDFSFAPEGHGAVTL